MSHERLHGAVCDTRGRDGDLGLGTGEGMSRVTFTLLPIAVVLLYWAVLACWQLGNPIAWAWRELHVFAREIGG